MLISSLANSDKERRWHPVHILAYALLALVAVAAVGALVIA